jgi:hypothetical protein
MRYMSPGIKLLAPAVVLVDACPDDSLQYLSASLLAFIGMDSEPTKQWSW